MWEYINLIDISILRFIREYFSSPLMDSIMIFITNLGDRGFIWIIIGIILLISKKYRENWIGNVNCLSCNKPYRGSIYKKYYTKAKGIYYFSRYRNNN